jgi:hypothetical protein
MNLNLIPSGLGTLDDRLVTGKSHRSSLRRLSNRTEPLMGIVPKYHISGFEAEPLLKGLRD